MTEVDEEKKQNDEKARVHHEINMLSRHIEERILHIRALEAGIKKNVEDIVKLRKNLYGILNAQPPKQNLDGLIENSNRLVVDSLIRRYKILTTDDLVDQDLLEKARKAYVVPGEIEIDEDALVSQDPDYLEDIWVQAWVSVTV